MNELSALNSAEIAKTALTPDEINATDTATLRRHLAQALTLTAQVLAYLAAIWGELERRGEDLSDLRSGIARYLPQIAHGTLEAELVVKYAGQRMLLGALSQLPIEQQRTVMAAGTLPRVTVDEFGDIVRETVPLQNLNATDIRYLFAEERLRTEDEQLKLRRKAVALRAKAPATPLARRVLVDAERRALVVGNSAAHADKIIEALSELLDVDVAALLKRHSDNQKALGSFTGKMKK